MPRIKHFAFALAVTFICTLALSAQAQTPRVSTVNVSAESDKVRIAAQGDVWEMRIEVSDESGDVVFQSGAITGQQLDWNMKDSQGERVAAGAYLVTVTFRNAAGKMRKRVEQVTVDEAERADTKRDAAPEAVQATITGAGTAGRIAKFTGAATIGNSVITESAGKIGIGTAAPTSTLHVNSTAANSPAILANNNASGGIGVKGRSFQASGIAVWGEHTGGGPGVVGTSGSGVGVEGNSGSGRGVSGTSVNNYGVRGYSSQSSGVIGESSRSTGVSGIGGTNGVSGASTNGIGVRATSTGGIGVRAISTNGIGVEASSTGGIGVNAYSTKNDGVVGVSFDNAHAGVVGSHPGSGNGVYGESHSGFAGYFAGVVVATGGVSNGSDRNLKANFSTVNPRSILDRLSAIPIQTWSYKSESDAVRHIGPMAQDFSAAFGVGSDDKHISTVDADGVTMAAIQGLYQMMQEKDKQIETLTHKVEQQQAQLNQVKRTIKRKRTARKN